MKILQIMGGGKSGGAETAFIDTCLAMKEAGQDIYVLTKKNQTREKILKQADIAYDTLLFGGPLDVVTSKKITATIKFFQPDIVQTWMNRAAKKTPNWKKTRTKKPYVTVGRVGGYYNNKYYQTMDYLAVLTPDLKRHMSEQGFDKTRIFQVNNFAETEQIEKPLNRDEFDTPSNATVLVSLARLHSLKGLDTIIDALPDCPNTFLWLAGEGPHEDELKQQARNLGVLDRIRFLGWRNDRAALLQAADICVFVSKHEGFGTVFVQAWSNKIPLIVSDAQGPKQFCTNLENCLMINMGDSGQLATAVKKLKDDKTLAFELVNNGYQKYMNEFTKEKTVEAYLKFYREISPEKVQGNLSAQRA